MWLFPISWRTSSYYDQDMANLTDIWSFVITQVYIIGGDGTQRGAAVIFEVISLIEYTHWFAMWIRAY